MKGGWDRRAFLVGDWSGGHGGGKTCLTVSGNLMAFYKCT